MSRDDDRADVEEIRRAAAAVSSLDLLVRLGVDTKGAQRQAGGGVLVPCFADGHNERTPSCSVRPTRDGHHALRCFGCDASAGDIFAIVALALRLDAFRDFPEVKRRTAELVGVTLREHDDGRPRWAAPPPRPAPPPPPPRFDLEPLVLVLASQGRLDGANPIAADVESYLAHRGLLEAARAAGCFALPPWSAVGPLLADVFGLDAVIGSGLLAADRPGWKCWAHRLCIPWRDRAGHVATLQRRLIGDGRPHGDHFDVRVSLGGGRKSPWIHLRCERAEEEAHELAAEWSQAAREGRLVFDDRPAEPPQPVVAEADTFDGYAALWLAARRDPKEARAHLRDHVSPIIGRRALVELTKRDVEDVVAALDAKVGAGALRWKTAQNIYGTLSKLLGDACHAKRRELRPLDGRPNPAADVHGPDRGDEHQGPYLFPREAAALLRCASIPLRWRTLYAVAAYTGLRLGELAVLRVEDVVLAGGYVNVHKARDRVTGGEKGTKGRRARRVPVELALRPLLASLVGGRAGGGHPPRRPAQAEGRRRAAHPRPTRRAHPGRAVR